MLAANGNCLPKNKKSNQDMENTFGIIINYESLVNICFLLMPSNEQTAFLEQLFYNLIVFT